MASILHLCSGKTIPSNQAKMDPTRPAPDKKLSILKGQLQQQTAQGNQALWASQELYQELRKN